MGYDVYCGICGNSCKSADVDYLIDIFPENTPNEIIKNIVKRIKWSNKSITLFSNNKNEINTNVYCESHLPFIDNDDYGIFLHYNCWKFVKITYNIELHYNNLPINYIDYNFKNSDGAPPIMNVNYGEIKKYWLQDMDFYKMYIDNNLYMLDNPLISTNTKNITRIKKIITQFKLKKDLRSGPQISATFYKKNTIKLGNNNKFWIIKNNKWNEIKEPVIKKKINFNLTNKKLYKIMRIPRIGEYNDIPLFIYNFKETKKERIIEFIGTNDSINSFEKLYKIS